MHIDRNRIYVCGISMGGSGTLGLGMCHGDIFAAALAGVPAGAGHVLYRMHFPTPPSPHATTADREKYLREVSGVGLPDAPPIVNFSSQTDTWSEGQPQLLRAAHDGRHSIIFAWGPWGHVNHYDVAHRAAYEFPWLQIRKDEAYPVFTDASTDQHYCGLAPPHPDTDGQINAVFRWKNVEDTAARFSIELRLVGNSDLTAPLKIPAESVTDVTLRRLQNFKVRAGQRYPWTFGAGPRAQSGVAVADAAGLAKLPAAGDPRPAGEPDSEAVTQTISGSRKWGLAPSAARCLSLFRRILHEHAGNATDRSPGTGLGRRAQAGQVTLEYFRRDDLVVERKGDDSPVTIADRRAEEVLRAGIAAAFPADAILGEELPERPGTSGFRWILDPIDGTKSFIHGVPLYGTLVGIEQAGEPVAGVIHIPALEETVYAAVGQGAWYLQGDRSPRRAQVSDAPRWPRACLSPAKWPATTRSAAATRTTASRPPPG